MRQSFLLAFIVGFGIQVAPADEPEPEAKKPPYERMLQGDDAKQAAELNKKIEQAEQADQYDKAIQYTEELLALRTKVQGADHWETADARRALEDFRKVAVLLPADRRRWRQAKAGVTAAQQLEAKGEFGKAEPFWREYRKW
jgi:hypothetical protein